MSRPARMTAATKPQPVQPVQPAGDPSAPAAGPASRVAGHVEALTAAAAALQGVFAAHTAGLVAEVSSADLLTLHRAASDLTWRLRTLTGDLDLEDVRRRLVGYFPAGGTLQIDLDDYSPHISRYTDDDVYAGDLEECLEGEDADAVEELFDDVLGLARSQGGASATLLFGPDGAQLS